MVSSVLLVNVEAFAVKNLSDEVVGLVVVVDEEDDEDADDDDGDDDAADEFDAEEVIDDLPGGVFVQLLSVAFTGSLEFVLLVVGVCEFDEF